MAENNNRLLSLTDATHNEIYQIAYDLSQRVTRFPRSCLSDRPYICCQADITGYMKVIVGGNTYYENTRRIAWLIKGNPIRANHEVVNSCTHIDCIKHLRQVEQTPRKFEQRNYEFHISRNTGVFYGDVQSMQTTPVTNPSDDYRIGLTWVVMRVLNRWYGSYAEGNGHTADELDQNCLFMAKELKNMLTYDQIDRIQRIDAHMTTNLADRGVVEECARLITQIREEK